MREREIFIEVLERGDPSERSALLDEVCQADVELRGRVEQLLAEHDRPEHFVLDSPPVDFDATEHHPISERPGTVIGPYKLLQQIGEGGMGVVFMAEQTAPLQRTVALKIIKPGMDTRQVIARFEAERQAVAMMDHPNIAKVLDAGTTDSGRPYFVMELVRGVLITKYCDEKHLSLRERLELFTQVCQAVQHAHQKGVIHRDIKPTNVLVAEYDHHAVPKVIDFGVAKAMAHRLTDRTMFTEFGQVLGTMEYMSPEQAKLNQLDIDTRSDIYSLGVLLYELLTGSTPFARKRLTEAAFDEMLRIIREEEPPKPSTRLRNTEQLSSIAGNRGSEPKKLSGFVKGELDWIVMKALEKDRNRRYETANSFAADITRFLNDEPVQACPPTAMYRFRKFARRNKRALVMATFAISAILLTMAGLSASLVLISNKNETTNNALQAETLAKADLQDTLERQRRDSYFRRIAMAHSELSVNNLGGALKLLKECPEDLREWEWRYLMRLCRVEPLIIRDKTGVCSIAFSPDGERLASGGGDGFVKVCSSRTGKLVKTFPAHVGFASSVAFHPDGDHLISVGADRLAKVWDLTTIPPRMLFDRPCDAIHTYGTAYAAVFSPLDPDLFAVGCEGTVTIWNWKTKTPVRTLPAQGNHRISLAFSRDGRRLATGDWRGSVKLWSPEAGGEPLCTFPETRNAVVALSFNKDGNRLATANFGRRVDVWDTTTGKPLRSLPQSGDGSGLVLGVAFSPDGRLIASAGEDTIVHVWDAENGRELLDLHGHTGVCGCVAFSPDGQRVASASVDGTIRVWDATPLRGDERQETATFSEHPVEVWSLAISPDGTKVASAGFGPPAMIWDLETREVSARFSDLDRVVFSVAWDRDSRRIAFAGASDDQFTVKVKDTRSQQDDFALPIGNEYFAVAFSSDGRYVVTGNAKGLVQVWDARGGQPICTLGSHKGMVRGVVFSPDGKRLASVSSDGEVRLWDSTRLGEKEKPQEPLRTFPAHSPGVCLNVAFSPDGKRLATAGQEYTVKIWDVETNNVLHTLRGHNGGVYTVAFSPDGRWVASAGADSTVKVWDSHTEELARSFRGHTGLVTSLAFSPDGRRLISASRDRTVKVWDMTQLNKLPEEKITRHESGVGVVGQLTPRMRVSSDPLKDP